MSTEYRKRSIIKTSIDSDNEVLPKTRNTDSTSSSGYSKADVSVVFWKIDLVFQYLKEIIEDNEINI